MNKVMKIRVMKVSKKTSFLCLLSQTQKNCFPCVNLYVVTITTPSPRTKSLNKMIGLFKHVFLYIIRKMCTALLYKNSKKNLYLSWDLFSKEGPNFYERKAVYVSESDLHSLILRSKLPAAKAFKKWVTSEVRPSIRMTSSYELQILKNEMILKY